MVGSQAIDAHRKRIDAAFERAKALESNPELLADFAKYLCVLVSGFLEKSISEIVLEYARGSGSPSLQRYVERNTARFTNANSERILSLLGAFDPEWRNKMAEFLVDEFKDATDSVYSLRNQIAHGSSVGLTYHRISNYYLAIKKVVEKAKEICLT